MNARTRVEAKTPATDLPLHVKYRPQDWSSVVGQDATIKSLRMALDKPTAPHSFLLTGPSGCGKTTLSRIIAHVVGCQPANIVEIDAATNNGIDDMREVTAALRYQGFGETPNKLIIIDECHALSKAAWQSLLKSVEEPPSHVYFAFCTTEPSKVPETIRTRCAAYDLKPVKYDDLVDLLVKVCDEERLPTSDAILGLVARAADGSPRKALVYLGQVAEIKDLDEVSRLLEQPLENKEIIDLCRALVSRSLTWEKLTATLKQIDGLTAESARVVITNYLGACLAGAKTEKAARPLYYMLDAFSRPYASSDKLAPLLLSFGRLMLED